MANTVFTAGSPILLTVEMLLRGDCNVGDRIYRLRMPAVGVHSGAIRLSPHIAAEGLSEAPPCGISSSEAPRPRRHRYTRR
jgi:hypothetical protein